MGDADDRDCRVRGSVDITGEITTRIHPQDAEQQNVRDKRDREDHDRDKRRFTVELVMLAVVSFYAALTFWQGCSNQKLVALSRETIDAARDQMLLDERPYIETELPYFVDPDTGEPINKPVKGKALDVKLTFKNVGRSAALNLQSVKVLPIGAQTAVAYFNKNDLPRGPSSTLLPQDEATLSVFSTNDVMVRRQSVVPSDQRIAWDGSNIFLFAYFFYNDTFGSSYCSQISLEYGGKNTWLEISNDQSLACEDHPRLHNSTLNQ